MRRLDRHLTQSVGTDLGRVSRPMTHRDTLTLGRTVTMNLYAGLTETLHQGNGGL